MTRSTEGQKQLPKRRRQPGAVNFVLTERDLEILAALGRYRYLRTSQIARLAFGANGTLQSARRRLKYLYHAGYVGRIQPMAEVTQAQSEMAYFLEKAGLALLDEDELPRFSRKQHVKPLFLRHALAVSEFRVNLELSARELPHIELHRVVMDHELKAHTDAAIGRRQYRLFEELTDPIGKRKLVVHPDMMFILRAEGKDGKQFQRLYFVEIDRGTEGLGVIADKLTGYHLYQREGVFKKFGVFDRFRLLIQTNSEKRARNILKLTEGHSSTMKVWIMDEQRNANCSLIASPIWHDRMGCTPKGLVRGNSHQESNFELRHLEAIQRK